MRSLGICFIYMTLLLCLQVWVYVMLGWNGYGPICQVKLYVEVSRPGMTGPWFGARVLLCCPTGGWFERRGEEKGAFYFFFDRIENRVRREMFGRGQTGLVLPARLAPGTSIACRSTYLRTGSMGR